MSSRDILDPTVLLGRYTFLQNSPSDLEAVKLYVPNGYQRTFSKIRTHMLGLFICTEHSVSEPTK